MNRIILTLRYENAQESIDWLKATFGFTEHVVYRDKEGIIAHAQLLFNNSMVMIGTQSDTSFDEFITLPKSISGKNTITPYIVIKEIEAHYKHSKANNANIVIELREEAYGGKYYACKDPEGYLWNFGSYDPWAVQT